MEHTKSIPRKRYASIFVGVGVVLAILGVIFLFALDAEKTFDLPWFIVGIGAIAIIYGVAQMLRSNRLHPEVFFFCKNGEKTF